MEIYLEKIRDLLARTYAHFTSRSVTNGVQTAQNDNLQVHEEKSKGVYVKGISDYYVSSTREVYEIMRMGGAARVVTSTSKWNVSLAPESISLYRYECGVLSLSLNLPYNNPATKYRVWGPEDRKPLPCGSGRFREGR